MDRRAFLVGAGGAASALAGCADLASLGDGGVAERDLPERPAEPTPEAVAAYVADYEEVRAHNRHAGEGATEVAVDAVATFDHGSGDERFATAQHAGTVYRQDDGARSVGDGADDLVCSTGVALDPERAVELLAITGVRGSYRVTASMEDDGVTGQGRIDVGLPSADRGPNVDVVVDEGGVSAWHLPSFEGI
ncbi:hypothetical protein [Halorubrum yunnanense]|uniref:Lipoprotein n=1 Tax=Halorubrum yunnanense TaxID=1526162 RepID=A0ABD5YFC2_9EURY|nr:hypothetical protein [Halorubrum yunnanense]